VIRQCKIKASLSLLLIKPHSMMTCSESGGLAPPFMTWALDLGEWSVSFTRLFIWGAFSEERTGLSFTISAGPRQRSLSQVRVPWHS
jgi:hypothetical protein